MLLNVLRYNKRKKCIKTENIITEVRIKISSYGEWDNQLKIKGDYLTVIKPELDRFYEQSKLSMDKNIEREKAYHEGVAKHCIK